MPAVVITGTPLWMPRLSHTLGETYTLHRYIERVAGYVARLADDGAAFIIVDGEDSEWPFWTTTPKASPATRRIPILLVSARSELRTEGLLAGADWVLPPDEMLAQIRRLLKDHARVPAPALLEQLECECGQALPPLASEGVERFNAGDYYRQHDLFEELWVQTEGPVRDLYRAILQVGVAYYQITRGNHRGAIKMLLRSVQWLSVLPDICQGVDVAQLRRDSYRVRAELERLKPDEIQQFDRNLLKPIVLRNSE